MTAHDPALVDRIAEALCGDHQWSTGGEGMRNLWRWAAHTALNAITTSPRHALVELPEPDEVDDDAQELFADWSIRADPTGSPGYRRIYTDWGMGSEYKTDMSPTRARYLGVNLLAAARAAESGSTTPESEE